MLHCFSCLIGTYFLLNAIDLFFPILSTNYCSWYIAKIKCNGWLFSNTCHYCLGRSILTRYVLANTYYTSTQFCVGRILALVESASEYSAKIQLQLWVTSLFYSSQCVNFNLLYFLCQTFYLFESCNFILKIFLAVISKTWLEIIGLKLKFCFDMQFGSQNFYSFRSNLCEVVDSQRSLSKKGV